MAGVSSESLATALGELEAKLPAASLALAQELFDVLATLDSSAGLRRALTDPSRSAAEKSSLVHGLLDGKVSADATAVVSSLAALRWSSARDIGDALETLAATVVVAVAENKSVAASTGSAGLDQLEEDLFAFNRIVTASHEVQAALMEPQASAEAKIALALRLVPLASEEAKVLIAQAVSHPRGLKPVKLVQHFVDLVAKRQQRWIATVTVTRPLTDEQLTRLQAGLDALYGRELKINLDLDPALIGGVRVKVADEVVDASVVNRLGQLRRQLAG